VRIISEGYAMCASDGSMTTQVIDDHRRDSDDDDDDEQVSEQQIDEDARNDTKKTDNSIIKRTSDMVQKVTLFNFDDMLKILYDQYWL
jgi:hypothetical protein